MIPYSEILWQRGKTKCRNHIPLSCHGRPCMEFWGTYEIEGTACEASAFLRDVAAYLEERRWADVIPPEVPFE